MFNLSERVVALGRWVFVAGVLLLFVFARPGSSPDAVVLAQGANPNPTFSFGSEVALGLGANYVNLNDGQLSVIQQGAGTQSYRIWVAGNILDSSGSTALLLASPLPTFTPANVTQPVFGPAPNPTPTDIFDENYAGPGTIITGCSGTCLHMLYEAENWYFCADYTKPACVASPGSPFWASIGIAKSTDNGVTWTNRSQVISSPDAKPTVTPTPSQGYGDLVPSAIISSGFLYVYYTYNSTTSGVTGDKMIEVARTPFPFTTYPPLFVKYNDGWGTQPGLMGTGSPIVRPISSPTHPYCVQPEREPGISYNTFLGYYLLTMVCDYFGTVSFGPRWFTSTSPDLVTWSDPVPIPDITPSDFTFFDWHPTLVSTDPLSQETTGRTGYIYYSKGVLAGSHNFNYRTYSISTPPP
jgi:hypothetical protein